MKPFSLLLCFLTAACGNFGAGLANLPVHFDAQQAKRDIAYGDEKWQKLDVYYPENVAHENLPVIVFFYGGRWENGSKDQYKFLASRMTSLGYAVVIPDYVKYPQAKFPAFVEDGAKAVAWTHNRADDYGFDAKRLFVMGHSAGAHIGALVASDKHYLAALGGTRGWIAAFAGLAGPYDFVPDDDDLQDMFGPPSRYAQMQVPTFIDGKEPPMLLLQGAKDTDVKRYNLDRLKDAIESKRGAVKTHIYPDLDHIGIIAQFSWIGRKDDVAGDVDAFFRSAR